MFLGTLFILYGIAITAQGARSWTHVCAALSNESAHPGTPGYSMHHACMHVPAIFPAALQDSSDLFRHDVAFCLGQRQDPAAVDVLKGLVADSSQHPM